MVTGWSNRSDFGVILNGGGIKLFINKFGAASIPTQIFDVRLESNKMAQTQNGMKLNTWRLRPTERRIVLLLGDLSMGFASLGIALLDWAAQDPYYNFSLQFLNERTPWWFWFLPPLWMVLLIELYDIRRASRRKDTVQGILIAAVVGLILYLVVFFLSTPETLPRRGVAIFIIAAVILTFLWRLVFIRVFTASLFLRRVLIVGAGRQGSELCRVLHDFNPMPFHLVGLVDDDNSKHNTLIEGYPVLGPADCIEDLVRERSITDIIFAISGEINPELLRVLLRVQEGGVELTTMPIVYEELLGRVPIFLLQSDWILRSFVDQRTVGVFYEGFRRLLDIVGGLVGTLIFLFFSPLVSLMILLETGQPVIFTQSRLGKNGQKYTIIKFRTMTQAASEKYTPPQAASAHDVRVTKVGRFLRKSHIDELPQFLNVLSGEMSLVGPRAEQSELVDLYQYKIPFYRARLLVKPGLTGWAQVNFGYAATVEETASKLEYDLYYIKHRNFLLDFVILLRTFSTVVGLKGQ
jgi:exopolysaccharide biosynthesis polyprenyl glycosylphosphotransferase